MPPQAECFQPRSADGAPDAMLLEQGPTALVSRVLSGAGGMGKTQLAVRYARALWELVNGICSYG